MLIERIDCAGARSPEQHALGRLHAALADIGSARTPCPRRELIELRADGPEAPPTAASVRLKAHVLVRGFPFVISCSSFAARCPHYDVRAQRRGRTALRADPTADRAAEGSGLGAPRSCRHRDRDTQPDRRSCRGSPTCGSDRRRLGDRKPRAQHRRRRAPTSRRQIEESQAELFCAARADRAPGAPAAANSPPRT